MEPISEVKMERSVSMRVVRGDDGDRDSILEEEEGLVVEVVKIPVRETFQPPPLSLSLTLLLLLLLSEALSRQRLDIR